MSPTRSGDQPSTQIGIIGVVPSLAAANFKLDGGLTFQVKNDTDTAVELEVKLGSMTTFVKTFFQPGWNPEIVKEIKVVATAGLVLKYGY